MINYLPSVISVASEQTSKADIHFTYNLPQPKGILIISLDSIPYNYTINGLISNKINGFHHPITFNSTVQNVIIKDLIADQSYNITISGLAIPVGGIYYSPINYVTRQVIANSSIEVKLKYNKSIEFIHTVEFNSTGYSELSIIPIIFSSYNSQYVYYGNNLDTNTSEIYEFLNSEVVNVSLLNPKGWKVSPDVITSDVNHVNFEYSNISSRLN